MTLSIESVVRWAAFAAGIVAMAVLVAGFQMARGSGRSDIDVRFLANATAELEVKPVGTVLRADGLHAGQAGHGHLTIENITDRPLGLQVRASAPGRDVDDLLEVRIREGRRTLFQGALGRLRGWTRRAMWLRPAEQVQLTLAVSVPDGHAGGFRGRAPDVTLDFLGGDG
jgi:hypothetical protein